MLMACYCPMVAQAQITTARIGYVDINYVVTHLPETKAAEAELTSLQQQYRKQLDAKVKVFQAKLESIRHQHTLPEAQRRTHEQNLQQMQRDIEKSQQEALGALEQRKTALMAAILANIQQAVEAVSLKEGFDLTLRAENILYGDTTFDITFPVLATLGVVLSEADKQQYLQTRSNLDPWRSIDK